MRSPDLSYGRLGALVLGVVAAQDDSGGSPPPPSTIDVSSGDGKMYVYGHSIAAGQGASDHNHAWSSLTAASLGLLETNRAVSAEDARTVYEDLTSYGDTHSVKWAVPTRGSLMALMCGINSIRLYGVTDLLAYEHFIRGICAEVRGASVIFHDTYTYSGSWTLSAYGQAMSNAVKYTNSIGAYYEVDFTGDVVSVFGFVNAGDAAQMEYKVDGAVVATRSYDTALSQSGDGDANSQICERLVGLGAGAHVLRVTNLTATYCYADAIVVEDVDPTPVALVAEHYMPSYTTGNNVSPYNNASDAIIDDYNAVLDTVAAEFVDGLVAVVRVATWNTVSTGSGIDEGSDVSVDGVHPDDQGHQKIATAILTLFGRPPVTLPFLDNFTRANGPLGSPWQAVLGLYHIVSDVAVQNGGAASPGFAGGATVCIAVMPTGVTDHSVEIVTTATLKNTVAPVVRFQDDQNFIMMDTEQDNNVYEVIADVSHSRLSLVSHPGDTLKLVAIGTNVEAFVNGVSQGSFTATLLSGTLVGVFGYDANGASLTAELSQFTADSSV
jgi:lysophospholipase L1-like esterase